MKTTPTIEYSIQLICQAPGEPGKTISIQFAYLLLTLHEVESVVGQDDKNTVIKAIVSATDELMPKSSK